MPPTEYAFLSWNGSQGRRLCPLAAFGGKSSRRQPFSLRQRLICVDPPRADRDIIANPIEVDGAIALVVRGGCSFGQKARRLQAAGAVAMLLANNSREEPFAAFTMGESEEECQQYDEEIVIPCVMMCLADVRDLFKKFPPTMKDGVVTLEVLESVEMNLVVEECKKEQLQRQRNGKKIKDGRDVVEDSYRGWFKRRTSSLIKILDPQANPTCNPLLHPGESNTRQDGAGKEGSNVANEIEDNSKKPLDSKAPLKTPLFAFIQWATNAEAYQLQFAPLSDFSRVTNNAIYEGKLAVCDPLLANEDPIRNADALVDSIALVKRGACTFPEKLERIQRCGAVAAIVGNDDTTDRDAAFVMSVDQINVAHVTIPAVMVSLNIFERLMSEDIRRIRILCLSGESAVNYLGEDGTTTLSLTEIPMPKPTDPDELVALFHSACRDGDHGACQRILDQECEDETARRALIKSIDTHHLTALHHACIGGNEHVIQLLLALGASIFAKDIGMQTPLHLACFHCHAAYVRIILQATESAAAVSMLPNIGGSTPLHYAAAAGSTECLELLLTVNARVETNGEYHFDGVDLRDLDGATALHIACRHVHVDCVMYLIAANADLNCVDNQGCSPMEIACEMINIPEHSADALDVTEKLLVGGAKMLKRQDEKNDAAAASSSCNSASSSGLFLDCIQSKVVKRELEILYLRHETQQSQRIIQELRRRQSEQHTQLEELQQQLAIVHQREQQRASMDVEHVQQQTAQQSQIDQLHLQMKTLLSVLQAQTDTTALFADGITPMISDFSALNSNIKHQVNGRVENHQEVNEQELALEAALARDLGKKFARQRKYALAETYFEKSLEIFSLPGVNRLLEHVRDLRVESQQRSERVLRTTQQQLTKIKCIEQFRASLKKINAPEKAAEAVEREICKLEALTEGSTEFDMVRKWIDWLVSLPWGDPLSGLQSDHLYTSGIDLFQQLEVLEQQEDLRRRHGAAQTIQRVFRDKYAVHLLTRFIAAVRIQAIFRGFKVRQQGKRNVTDTDVSVMNCCNTSLHPTLGTLAGESNQGNDVLAVNYTVDVDPVAQRKLRVKQLKVVAGILFDQPLNHEIGHNTHPCVHVVQLLRASTSISSTIRNTTLVKEIPAIRYYVWSRWGQKLQEKCQCVLSGPYEQPSTAQLRYDRILRSLATPNLCPRSDMLTDVKSISLELSGCVPKACGG